MTKEKILVLLKQKKLLFILGMLLGIPLIFFLLSIARKDSSPMNNNNEFEPTKVQVQTTRVPVKEIKITSVWPIDAATNVDQNTPIVITFLDGIPLITPTISISPSLEGALKVDSATKTITFTPSRSFQAGTTYKASLNFGGTSFITKQQGILTQYEWSFTIGEQQGESGFDKQAMEDYMELRSLAENAYQERKRRLPFIVFLPHYHDHYTVEIASTSDTVTITTFAPHPDYHLAYRQEALQWIRSKGGNTDTLTIRYNPANP